MVPLTPLTPRTPRTYGPADPLSASKDSVLFAASLTPKAFDIDVGNICHVALDSSLTTETPTLVSDKCETTSGVAIAAAPVPVPAALPPLLGEIAGPAPAGVLQTRLSAGLRPERPDMSRRAYGADPLALRPARLRAGSQGFVNLKWRPSGVSLMEAPPMPPADRLFPLAHDAPRSAPDRGFARVGGFAAPAAHPTRGPTRGPAGAPARGPTGGMREASLPGLLTPAQEAELFPAFAPRSAPVPGPAPPHGLGGGPRAVPIPDHAQHRQRLREKFMRAGAVALHDYELLELVLFRAIPRRDVKPIAKRLLNMFGDFNHVISAPPARLAEVEGVGDAVVQELKIIEAAAHSFAQAKVIGRDAISSWDALVTYCRQRMAHEAIEQFRILFLDRKNILIADEAQQVGTVDHVPVYPREVVKRALMLNASAIILVHNHPSGDPTPSQADIDMTARVCRACTAVGLSVHDHIVVGKERVASFHALGLID